MKKIVDIENVGVVAKSFTIESMAEEINKLTPEVIGRYKVNAVRVSKIINSDECAQKICDIVEKLM